MKISYFFENHFPLVRDSLHLYLHWALEDTWEERLRVGFEEVELRAIKPAL